MNKDDTIYVTMLLISIPLGILFKNSKSTRYKQVWSSVIGLAIVLIVCFKDIIHSLLIVTINALFIKLMHPKYLPIFSFLISFSYLLFFRTTDYFGLPKPAPYSNAVQLILTLKIVGLAFEWHDTHKRKIKLKNLSSNQTKQEDIDKLKLEIEYLSLKSKPTIFEVFAYSYCYVGILTGPYFKYRTYRDWLEMKHGNKIDTFKHIIKRARTLPFIIIGYLVLSKFVSFKDAAEDKFYENSLSYRLIYMVLIFYLFRFRFYIAWIFAEISCMAAAFGVYPKSTIPKPGAGPTDLVEYNNFDSTKPTEYSFSAIHNIDEYGCEMAPTVKQVLHHWNMTIQYWMANNIYKRVPFRPIGQPVTMAVSAYWHGIHAGYYLSMLTTTPCMLAESYMEKGLKRHLNQRYHRIYDICTWFFRTREFDYMSLGFILLRYDLTIRFWKSVYFIGHVASLFFIILGIILIKLQKSKNHKNEQHDIKSS